MGQSTMQDRRTFIKGAGAIAAVAAGAAIPATAFGAYAADHADPAADLVAMTAEPTAAPTATEDGWDGEFDVVIVGAGMAGVCAAITVATEGEGATCLLLEKEASASGNSPYSAGDVLYCDDASEAEVYLQNLIGGATPDDVIHAFAVELQENLNWFKSLGMTEDMLYMNPPDPTGEKTMEYAEFPNDHTVGYFEFDPEKGEYYHTYQFLFEALNTHADVVTYLPSTPMEELIQDPETKTILGVLAAGKRYKAKRGVLMCTGGFENDPEMMFTYTGIQGCIPLAGAANTGDGHRACMKIGADFWHMHGGAQFWMTLRDLENTRFASVKHSFNTKQHGITIGVNGRRFYNDYDGCNVYKGTAADSNMACNVGYRHGITQFGGNWVHLPLPPKGWFIFDQAGLEAGAFPTDISEDIVADGWAVSADTIEDLAAAIEVPAEELVKTVDLWNQWCDQGEDLAFYRPSDTLTPIKTGPFYAILCIPTMLNTDGGPVRSAKGEILDPDGNPIPHLYSAGEFGSVWGHFYQGCGNLGECAAFGRISARSALANEPLA